jgi:GxxExxY protein
MAVDIAPIAADISRERLDAISWVIIGAAQKVSSVLGQGFLEKVYENSMLVELARRGYRVTQQKPVQVSYEGAIVGNYVPDLIVDDAIVVEVKAVTCLEPMHRQQCSNYLRATGYRVCLLLNFGQRRLEVKRIVANF